MSILPATSSDRCSFCGDKAEWEVSDFDTLPTYVCGSNGKEVFCKNGNTPRLKNIDKVMEAIRTLDDVGRFSENQSYVILAGEAREALMEVCDAKT